MHKITVQEYKTLVKKKSKYGNRKTDVGRGEFDSKKEALYERDLFFAVKALEIKNYHVQVPFKLEVNGIPVCTYIADFVIEHLDDSLEIVDVKGYKTKEFRIKWKLLQALYGKKYSYTIG